MGKRVLVWEARWQRLADAGLTTRQLEEVYRVIDEAQGFRTMRVAESAWASLERVKVQHSGYQEAATR